MTRLKILFISFLMSSTSTAKSFKESTIDNENSNEAIKLTPSGLVSDKESITIYLKNDNILSISEFSKYYNPEEHHQTNFRFIEETDTDNVNKVKSKNDKTTLENPEIKKANEENKTDSNVATTIVDSKEVSSESTSEELSTETIENESTTTSIKDQDKTTKLIESYEHDLDSPEHIESTESYFKNNDFNNDTNSDKREVIMPAIPSRRSFVPNEKLFLDNKVGMNNKSVEDVKADQDTVQNSDANNIKKPNDQTEAENTVETPTVAPQKIYARPIIPQKQFHNLTPLPRLQGGGSESLTKISNEQTNEEINFRRLKMTPDEYKQSNNLDKTGEISIDGKSIDDYNSNIYENAYQYRPTKVESRSQQPLSKQPIYNSLYLKLSQASDHPYRNIIPPVRQNFGNYGTILPYFNVQYPYLQNVGPYNFVRRTRRYSSCNNCGRNKRKIYRN